MSGLSERVVHTIVVTVGDELLLGDTVDTNGARIGRALAELGAPVVRRITVGDVQSHIMAAVNRSIDEASVVIVTGGLGPTPDDITREAVASLTGSPLRLDPELEAALRERYRAAGYTHFPENNLRQAMVPEGARVLPNERGTAPGLALVWLDTLIVLLPGVPRELEWMLAGPVAELLRKAFPEGLRPPVHRRLHTTGIAESRLAERVEALLPADRGPVRLAYLPSLRGVTLRFTVPGQVPPDEAKAWLDRMESALAELREYVYEGDDLVEAVAHALETGGRTLAVAESCTGGLIAKRLTDRSGSSRWFLGGVVAYADDVKVRQLGVERQVLARVGAVSEEVALGMARGVARALGADAGIGVTGIAGPTGGTPDKPVGTVWYAASVGERAKAEMRRFVGDREAVRERAAQAALKLLHRLLTE